MPETAQPVIHEVWLGADTDLGGLVIIKAEEPLNSSIFPPQTLPKIPSRNALRPPRPPMLWAGSAESGRVIYASLLFQDTRAYCLAGQSCSRSLPHPVPPKQRFPITALQKMSKALFNYSLSEVL